MKKCIYGVWVLLYKCKISEIPRSGLLGLTFRVP